MKRLVTASGHREWEMMLSVKKLCLVRWRTKLNSREVTCRGVYKCDFSFFYAPILLSSFAQACNFHACLLDFSS